MLKIQEMTWREFDEKRRDALFVVIPTGAIEVYGPGLPLGTDTIIAEEIANRIAERMNVIVGPTLEVGDSLPLYDFPGTLTVRPEGFKMYLEDVCLSFIKWGIKKFCFVNAHAGNVPIIKQLCWKLKESDGIESCQIFWWQFIQPLCEGVTQYSGKMAHGHASEVGTSCMLYLKPELVRKTECVRTEPIEDPYPDVIKYIRFGEYTDTGTIGDATVASAEKGEIIVKKAIGRIVTFLESYFTPGI